MTKRTRTILVRITGALFYALLVYGLWHYLQALDPARLFAATIDPLWLIAAALLAVCAKLPYALVWRRLLIGMGVRIPNLAGLFRVYQISWLGRYTPGKAVMVGARLVYAERVGATRSQALISFLVEQILQLSVGTGMGLTLVVLADRFALPLWLSILLAGAVVIGWLITSPPVLRRGLAFAFRLVGREALDVFPDQASITRAAALHGLIQLGFGAYTGLAAASLFGVDFILQPAMYAHIWGAFALSVTIGMLAIFAPAGLGAREAIQLLLLQSVLEPEQAALFTVLHRAVELGTDLLLFAAIQLGGLRAARESD